MNGVTPMADRESDGMILLDSYWGKQLGFTSKKWTDKSFIWKDGRYIVISYLSAREPGKGHFGSLCKRILQLGLGIQVPVPLPRMEAILKAHGFRVTEVDAEAGRIELWVKEPGEAWRAA